MENIKNISIRKFLEQQGITPQHDYGYYGMYHCPFREDRNASSKVDYRKNLWNDFGTGEGGSIIDLVMKMMAARLAMQSKCWIAAQPFVRTNITTLKHHNRVTIQIFLFTVINLLK